MFSLGVIFYELLTGRLPFRGGLSTVIHGVLSATPAKPSECVEGPGSSLWTQICMKMLSKKGVGSIRFDAAVSQRTRFSFYG